MPTKDEYRAANLLIQQHGDDALGVAANKLKKFLEGEQDVKAASVWLGVCEAIEELQAGADGKTVH